MAVGPCDASLFNLGFQDDANLVLLGREESLRRTAADREAMSGGNKPD